MPIDRAVISGLMYGQLIQNRIHLQTETFQEVDEVCAHVWNSWVNTIRQLQSADIRYTTVTVHRIDGGAGEQFTETRDITGAQGPENNTPSFLAGVLQFQTGLAGRQNRGRYYVAAPRMGAIQFGSFKATELTLWQQQTALLEQAYIGPTGGSTGIGLLIRHVNTGGFVAVKHIAMRPILGVQRRRNIGVGA